MVVIIDFYFLLWNEFDSTEDLLEIIIHWYLICIGSDDIMYFSCHWMIMHVTSVKNTNTSYSTDIDEIVLSICHLNQGEIIDLKIDKRVVVNFLLLLYSTFQAIFYNITLFIITYIYHVLLLMWINHWICQMTP